MNRLNFFKDRLSGDRLVPPLDDCPFSRARHSFLSNLSETMTSFNWKQHQHFLNTFKQYRTEIEGLTIHFLRISLPKGAIQKFSTSLDASRFSWKLLGFLQGKLYLQLNMN
ncbi:hypothetical protein COOONC_26983 [Cooperia oncophora]